MSLMQFIYFILLLISTTCLVSRHVASHELTDDLERNESKIEIPPDVAQIETNKIEDPITKENEELSENLLQPETVPDELSIENETVGIPSPPKHEANNSENLMIPVFSEWTQQQMQEAEKKLVELTNSSDLNRDVKNETTPKVQIVKMRQKNYASPDCGAKVLASNPEAQSTSSVLTDKDEYLLSPCTDRIWFVVELCDSIQAQRVELANFELFSSQLKAVSISVSNRFPTRDWTSAGQFDAKIERDVQVFELTSTLFGKFVRVDLTYTNTEHYCPLSFFRVFGTSEIEAFEVENEVANPIEDDEDEQEQTNVQQPKENLLNRAHNAVMSIVQKAAEVLVKGNGNNTKSNETTKNSLQRDCITWSHDVICKTCSIDERNELNSLISCKNFELINLLDGNIKNHLVNSDTCHPILGFDLKSEEFGSTKSFIISILPKKYIAAMCNFLAKDQKSLNLRIGELEAIPEISQNLKGDENSLRNISKKPEDPLCKQEDEIPAVNITDTTVENVNSSEEQKNTSISIDELNIFNVVNQSEKEVPQVNESNLSKEQSNLTQEKVKTNEDENQQNQDTKKQQASNTAPIESADEIKPEIKAPTPETVKVVQTTESKETRSQQEHVEIKINGDVRSSNPPESVFLRLSNRIKTLEKNMTLSTQYLEELSRRYKKQIEDLQQSFLKLQTSLDDQNQRKRDSDRKHKEEKRLLESDVLDLGNKLEYMEVIIIVLTVFFTVQTILVIALFKRVNILRRSFVALQEPIGSNPSSPSLMVLDRSKINGRKRSKQRMRKISAPNILTQRSPVKNEFPPPSPVLSRTVSAPNKFSALCSSPSIEDKENYSDMQAMLEENDDILIPGFEGLKLNDDDSMQSNDIDTASTASAHSGKLSNKSFKFKRRLSSPFQLKRPVKTKESERTNPPREKKAQSESPVSRNQENFIEIHKSKSFQDEDDGSVKFKKSSSFKKLFKKLF